MAALRSYSPHGGVVIKVQKLRLGQKKNVLKISTFVWGSYSVIQNCFYLGRDLISSFMLGCTCEEIDNGGKSHIQNERKDPQDTYHGLSCIGLTVQGPFKRSSSALDDIRQRALALNSRKRRLITPRVEWLVFFAVCFLFLVAVRWGRPPAWESWLSASLSQYRLLPLTALPGWARMKSSFHALAVKPWPAVLKSCELFPYSFMNSLTRCGKFIRNGFKFVDPRTRRLKELDAFWISIWCLRELLFFFFLLLF